MKKMRLKDSIIIDLDTNDVDRALALITNLAPLVGGFKIGFALMTAMFASVESVTGQQVFVNLNKIYHLFILLGTSFSNVSRLISEGKGAGCASVICTTQGLLLVGNKGEKISTTIAGGLEKVGPESYISIGPSVIQEEDPIFIVKKKLIAVKKTLRKESPYFF